MASKLEDGDFRRAVRIASSDESFAPTNDSTLDLMKQKHPPSHPQSVFPPQENTTQPLEVSSSDILASIQPFPAGSARGPDGLRPQHLKDLITSCFGLGANLLLQSMTDFVNFALRGDIPEHARLYFFGASLISLNKKSGGVRPIAVGGTLRRLVAKCASRAVRDEMGALLAPVQLGYGTPMGAEAAVHAARVYLRNIQSGQVLLKVDFANVFNHIRRDKLLQSVLNEVPGIYWLVHAAYSTPSFLFFGSHTIDSAEGVQQGDPLGPLLFSLTIHHLVCYLKSDFGVFYLDDGTLGGNWQDVIEDLQQIEEAAGSLGLTLNHHKCEIISTDDGARDSMLAFSPSLQFVEPSEACLLGSPIGGPNSIDDVLSSKKASLELLGVRLKLLHSHDALCLLGSQLSPRRRGVPWCGMPHAGTLMNLPTILWLFEKQVLLPSEQKTPISRSMVKFAVPTPLFPSR